MTTPSRSRRFVKIGVVALVVIGLVVAWRLGVFSYFGAPRELAQALVDMGGWGYVAFVAAYTVLQPFGVPGTIFVVAAPLIWPWPIAFALSMTGTMAASVVGFSFARFIAKEWVSKRIPARLRKYDAALERNAFQTVVILRLILWMPQVLHSFFGVSKISFWTHFWGSLIGYAPPLFAVSVLGASMFDASGNMQPVAWPIMGGFVVVSGVIGGVAWVRSRRRAKMDVAQDASEASTSAAVEAPP